MKTIRVSQPGKLAVVEEPIPTLESSEDLLIQVKAAGICGSDISIYRGTSPVASYPRVIGHEFAGEVVAAGSGVTRAALGDHVVVDPVMSCGSCRVCEKGRPNVCDGLNVLGVHVDGGFQEYVRVPQRLVHRVPREMPWPIAALVEPYAVAAQVADRGGVAHGDTVLILGCGQIALTVLQVCKLLGAFCIVTDLVDSRLQRARDFGADRAINSGCQDVRQTVMAYTGGLGADIAIDAACVGDTLQQAAACCRNAGVVVTMGFADRTIPITELDVTKKELDIRGSRLNNNKFPQVIAWFAENRLNPAGIITHTLPFTQVTEGFDRVKNDPENTMKIILEFPQ